MRNNGELELFFIGTGSAFAKKLNQTNFLIIKGDAHIMVDFGMTGPRALLATAGLEPTDIEVVLPTHCHGDHVAGIEGLALMNRYVGQRFMDKPLLEIIIAEDYQELLWEQSLKGGLSPNEKTHHPSGLLEFTDFFKVVRPQLKTRQPREIFELDFKGIRLEIFRTFHIPEGAASWKDSVLSYGLFVDQRVFFSGDTQFDRELIDLYWEKSEVMFQDVQFFTGGVHNSLEELNTLPPEIKTKMYLVHYNDAWLEKDITGFGGWCEQGVRYLF